jgi:mannitol/fructose-specific phosphotransferase system IIA component (Ntr-type)
MKISAVLPPEHIHLDVSLDAKDDVLQFIAQSLEKLKLTQDSAAVYGALAKRERMMSTGIGGGLGIPHALTPSVEELCLLMIRPDRPIPFDALDDLPVRVVFGLLVPENETTLHLRALAAISGLCKKPGFLEGVSGAKDSAQLHARIKEMESPDDLPG